jgi:molybdopterin converting factor small subunit
MERPAVRVRVDYYAYFRDKRGLSTEDVETQATTLAELYCELAERHGFKLPLSSVRVVVGSEFVHMGAKLSAEDAISFIPPVAGG